jgi:hypothetical protein
MLLTYFLNDFEMVPVAPIITGITLVFTFHMRHYYYYYYYYYYYSINHLLTCWFTSRGPILHLAQNIQN